MANLEKQRAEMLEYLNKLTHQVRNNEVHSLAIFATEHKRDNPHENRRLAREIWICPAQAGELANAMHGVITGMIREGYIPCVQLKVAVEDDVQPRVLN